MICLNYFLDAVRTKLEKLEELKSKFDNSTDVDKVALSIEYDPPNSKKTEIKVHKPKICKKGK